MELQHLAQTFERGAIILGRRLRRRASGCRFRGFIGAAGLAIVASSGDFVAGRAISLQTNPEGFRQPSLDQTIPRRGKISSFTRSNTNANTQAAASVIATIAPDSGAIAMPAIARTLAIVTSKSEEPANHTLGRRLQTRGRPRMA